MPRLAPCPPAPEEAVGNLAHFVPHSRPRPRKPDEAANGQMELEPPCARMRVGTCARPHNGRSLQPVFLNEVPSLRAVDPSAPPSPPRPILSGRRSIRPSHNDTASG